MSVNMWIGVGNLGKDPELRTTGSGNSVCNFSIACNERRKDESGEWSDHTEWVRIVCFGRTAENASRFLSKGRQVYVQGRLQTREYTDRDGQQRRSTEVVAQTVQFLQGGTDAPRDRGKSSHSKPNPSQARPTDDDIPF